MSGTDRTSRFGTARGAATRMTPTEAANRRCHSQIFVDVRFAPMK
jgi:hypothetical protein